MRIQGYIVFGTCLTNVINDLKNYNSLFCEKKMFPYAPPFPEIKIFTPFVVPVNNNEVKKLNQVKNNSAIIIFLQNFLN